MGLFYRIIEQGHSSLTTTVILLSLMGTVSTIPPTYPANSPKSIFERIWTETEKRPPPTYLQLLFEYLTSGHPAAALVDSSGRQGGNRTVLQTLLPSKLRHETAFYNFTSIKIPFQDSHSVQLLFTLRQNLLNFTSTQVTLQVASESVQEFHHFLWTPERHFYALSLTRLLRHLPPTTVDLLELTFSLSNHNGEKIPLDFLFDLDVNSPFLLIHQFPELDVSPEILQEFRTTQVPLRRKRTSRSAHRHHRRVLNTKCHRQEWLVKPSDIGLDDIIAPPLIDLGLCTGQCPFPLLNDVFNFSLHSYFVDRHRVLEGLSTPEQLLGSSCVAVSYRPLMVMEGGVTGHIVALHHNALVLSCGCRY